MDNATISLHGLRALLLPAGAEDAISEMEAALHRAINAARVADHLVCDLLDQSQPPEPGDGPDTITLEVDRDFVAAVAFAANNALDHATRLDRRFTELVREIRAGLGKTPSR